MFTEAQFRAAFRSAVESEADLIGGTKDVEYAPVVVSDSNERRPAWRGLGRYGLVAAGVAVAIVGAGAWLQNGTAARTTPSHEATAGGITDVALVTVDGDPASALARLDGPLGIVEGCIAVGGTLVALDAHMWSWDTDAGVLSNSLLGEQYRIGDHVVVGGGFVSMEDARSAGVTFPESCADHEGELFSS